MKITIDKESSELLRTLDVLGMPAFIVNKGWAILSCNDAALTFFEFDRGSVIGRHIEKFISMEDLPPHQAMPLNTASGDSFPSLRAFCFRKNARPISSRIAVVPAGEHLPDRRIVIVRENAGPRPAQPELPAPASRKKQRQES